MSFTASALVLTWVALLLLSLVVAGLVRQVHHLQRSLPAAAARPTARGRVGAILPAIAGVDTTRVRLLLLLDAECEACATLLDGVQGTLSDHVVRTGLALLYAGAPDPGAARLGAPVVSDADGVFAAVGATALPYGVALDTGGRVAAASPVGAVSELMPLLAAAALDDPAPTNGIQPEVTR